ncbi:MAG: hypothetical protein ABIE07_03940 [Candidatus Zixiibacteriota bacterium]
MEFKGAPPPGRAPKSTYTSLAATQAHEGQHQKEWKTVLDAQWELAEPKIEALQTACVIPAVDTPEEAVAKMKAAADAFLKDAITEAKKNRPSHTKPSNDETQPNTSKCYTKQKEVHDALIAELKTKWPGC